MPLPLTLPKRVRSLAREEVYAQLSTWIIDGTLSPEEHLRDQEIAERLGVSRTPVREALRRLEDEGLIETALNRWTRVAPLQATQAAELYPVVETLEVLALRLAAPALTPVELNHMRDLDHVLQGALHRQDVQAAVQADTEFHEVWITRSGNSELQQTLRTLKRKLRRIEIASFMVVGSGQASVNEHEALLTGLQKGQLEEAIQALEGNWRGSFNRLQDWLVTVKGIT